MAELINDGLVAWENFTAQFDGKPALECYVRSLYAGNPRARIDELKTEVWLDVAQGQQLDGIGEIVVLPRNRGAIKYVNFFGFKDQPAIGGFNEYRLRRKHEGFTNGAYDLPDDDYRKLLRWKISINNGHGTTQEIIDSLKSIFNADLVIVTDAGNAKIRVYISKMYNVKDELLMNIKAYIPKMAGVGLIVSCGSSTPFGFKKQGFLGFNQGVIARGI